jgi:hypothetical protein
MIMGMVEITMLLHIIMGKIVAIITMAHQLRIMQVVVDINKTITTMIMAMEQPQHHHQLHTSKLLTIINIIQVKVIINNNNNNNNNG